MPEESDDAGFVFALRDDAEDVALKDFRIGAGTAVGPPGRLNAGADKRTVDELDESTESSGREESR